MRNSISRAAITSGVPATRSAPINYVSEGAIPTRLVSPSGTLVVSLCVLATILCGCGSIAELRPTESDDIEAITEQSRRLSDAYVRGDIADLVAVYAEDGIAAPGGTDFIQGHDALEEFWALPEGSTILRHAATPTLIKVDGDHAYDWGYYEGQASREGETLPPFRGKYVIVWERDADGVWRIAMDMWNDLPENQ